MSDTATGPKPSPEKEYRLVPHPDFPSPAVTLSVGVSTYLTDNQLSVTFRYLLSGAIDLLDLPSSKSSVRADNLWHRTCFEVFLGTSGADDYLEFNFAPTREWAIYAFDGYRKNIVVRNVQTPRIGNPTRTTAYQIHSVMYPKSHGPFDLNISAVLEARDGTKSYWALAHAPGPPDFHNRDCFVATLRAPDAP